LKLIQGAKLNLLIKGPNWYISKHQKPNYNLSFSSKMTPFWSHCSPPLSFRTDQTDSTGNKSGNSRPRHHDFLPMIPLMDWWTEERVFSACSGSIKRQSRAEARGGTEGGRTGRKLRVRIGGNWEVEQRGIGPENQRQKKSKTGEENRSRKRETQAKTRKKNPERQRKTKAKTGAEPKQLTRESFGPAKPRFQDP